MCPIYNPGSVEMWDECLVAELWLKLSRSICYKLQLKCDYLGLLS